jgi:superfamily II DNA helicase RecQ
MNKIDISQFPEEEKIRAKDGVDQVAAYCRTNACRRVHILGHFDETSRAEDCHRGCDNCANNTPLKTEAVTDVGLAAIRLVKSLTQPPMLINVSGTLLNETLLGGKTQVVNSARSNSHQSYGAARGMRATLNYVLDKLLSINGLAMHRKQNGMGSNDYWVVRAPRHNIHLLLTLGQLGSQAQHMLEHNTPVHITYRCSQSTATPQSGTRSSNKKAKARKSDTVPTTSNNCDDMGDPSAIAPFIPADEDYGLNQNGDDALMRSTQSLHISVPSTSHQLAVGPAPTPIASSSRQASRPSNVSSNTQSLRISHKSTLGAWRTKVR